MRQGRRRGNYKFTERTQSKKGILALILAGISFAGLGLTVYYSYRNGGNGSMYLGSTGIFALLFGIVALVLGIQSLWEENSFRFVPFFSVVCSFLAAGTWIALYIVGMRM